MESVVTPQPLEVERNEFDTDADASGNRSILLKKETNLKFKNTQDIRKFKFNSPLICVKDIL